MFNLTSGRAASEEVAKFLISAETMGIDQMKIFIKECQQDENRFDRPIKRNIIRNFTSKEKKSKSAHKQIDDVKIERNILGKVLCLALKNQIDLENVLSYPLAIIPHSFAHFDRFIISGKQKLELTTLLCSMECQPENPKPFESKDIEVDIIDGFDLMSTFKEPPAKYGHLAILYLRKICGTNAHEIHVIFDRHESPSPKDMDIKKYKDMYENASFKIKGPNQERNRSLLKCLQDNSFKEELVSFFIAYWSTDEFDLSILGEKRVFVAFGGECRLFSKETRGKVLLSFTNNHFEVESKMIFHLYKIRAKNIRIRTPNADTILVYMLYHIQFWRNDREIWIEVGDINKNTFKYINVRQIYESLTSVFVNALPAWYIFTGCSFEPSFYGKGRNTCFKLLKKNVQFQAAFGRIGNSDELKEEDITNLEEYTCQLYNSKTPNVNTSRVDIFQNAYGSKSDVYFNKKGNEIYKKFKIV